MFQYKYMSGQHMRVVSLLASIDWQHFMVQTGNELQDMGKDFKYWYWKY